MVYSTVAEDTPEDLLPSRAGGLQRCFSEFPLCLCYKSLPVSLSEVRKRTRFLLLGRGVTGEGDNDFREVVGPKVGKGEPLGMREKISALKADIWRGGLALGKKASGKILVHNKVELLIAPSRASPLASALSSPCSGEPVRMVGVKVAKHHLVSTVLQKGVKDRGSYSSGGRRTQEGYTRKRRSMWFSRGQPRLPELPPCHHQGVCLRQAPCRGWSVGREWTSPPPPPVG